MDPEVLALLVPVIALLIPIVAIWTKHLQTLEQLRLQAGRRDAEKSAEMEKLRTEVQELKEIVYQQTLALDGLMTERRAMNQASEPSDAEVRQRLGKQQDTRS
ncbi:MAG: hypothetical protein N2109_08410 [Fimbriimonadales bacterium]|nr:hypothetical protein [Fimbriimonadales bacterium]